MAVDERQVAQIVERVVRELMNDGTGPVGDDGLVHASSTRAAGAAPARPVSGAASGNGRPSNGASSQWSPSGSTIGLFDDADAAVAAAEEAQRQLKAGGLSLRRDIVAAIRRKTEERAEVWGRHARDETGMGRYDSKKEKNLLVGRNTPGVEDLEVRLLKGDSGMHVIDGLPWGVICSITPSTNPTATVINNGITMVSAGNAVVFCPHPSAKRCTQQTLSELNEAIIAVGGPRNLFCGLREPSIRAAQSVMQHERIKIIAATGGGGVVRAAFESNKKVFAAGPGNPPVLVDETADLDRAARLTIKGASFDNNLPCVAEKVCFVVRERMDEFVRLIERHGARLLSAQEVEQIQPVVLDGEHPRRESIGQDAAELLRRAGLPVNGNPELIVARLDREHPLVVHEQMMPFLPLVDVRDFDEGLQLAIKVESGFGHTSVLYSRNTDHITRWTDQIGTYIQCINGPSYAWSGDEGEGYATMTVTTPTGEGITSPRTWQRRRHLVYSGMLNT